MTATVRATAALVSDAMAEPYPLITALLGGTAAMRKGIEPPVNI